MEIARIILVSLSFIVLGVLFARTIRHWHLAGAFPFIVQIVLVAIWSIGSVFEMAVPDLPDKLFWRNVQQIGVFFTPVNCLVFAVHFGRYKAWSRWLPLFWLAPVASVVLMFTDEAHRLMRFTVSLGSADGMLRVDLTVVGTLFITYNFAMTALAMVLLGLHAAKAAVRMRKQVVYAIASIFLATVVSLLNFVWLSKSDYNIPVVAMYLPSCLILFCSLFQHKLFLVSPIAREKVFDVLDQGIIVTDDQGMIVDRNPHAMHLVNAFFGIGAEIAGRGIIDVFAGYPEWIRLVTEGLAGQYEAQSPLKDTSMLYMRIKVYPLRSDRGRLIGMVSLLRDITARRLQERELMSKADMDSLTGLLNRSGFLQACRGAVDGAKSRGGPVSVLMIDLDRLKHINDTYGHFSGDRALLCVSDVLRHTLRQQDVIGRIGGDEFAVVLPDTWAGEAGGIAERILRETRAAGVEMENREIISISLSIGICDNRISGGEAERLLNLADKAMYMAKRRSRDCFVAWEHSAGLDLESERAGG